AWPAMGAIHARAACRRQIRSALSYSPNPNRATNVPVTIAHAGGKATVRVNQRNQPDRDRAFICLGTFRFQQGMDGYVEIRNDGVDGYVIIDCVLWLPVTH